MGSYLQGLCTYPCTTAPLLPKMTNNYLQQVATRSQPFQVLEQTLGKEHSLTALGAKITETLYTEDRWRWTPERGLEVAIPQNYGSNYIARESPAELQRRLDASSYAGSNDYVDNGLLREDYIWLLAQCLHYCLPYPLTEVDAASSIAEALRGGQLNQPRQLVLLSQKLEGDYRRQQRLAALEANVRCETETEVDWTGNDNVEGTSSGEDEEEDLSQMNRTNFVVLIPSGPGKQRATTPITISSDSSWDDDEDEDEPYFYDERADEDYINSPSASATLSDSDVASVPDQRVTRSGGAAKSLNMARSIAEDSDSICLGRRRNPTNEKSNVGQTTAGTMKGTISPSKGNALRISSYEKRKKSVLTPCPLTNKPGQSERHLFGLPRYFAPPKNSYSIGGVKSMSHTIATRPATDRCTDEEPRKTTTTPSLVEHQTCAGQKTISPARLTTSAKTPTSASAAPELIAITAAGSKRVKKDARTAITHSKIIVISDSDDEERRRASLNTKDQAPNGLKKRKRTDTNSNQAQSRLRGSTYSLPPDDSGDGASRSSKRQKARGRSHTTISQQFRQSKPSVLKKPVSSNAASSSSSQKRQHEVLCTKSKDQGAQTAANVHVTPKNHLGTANNTAQARSKAIASQSAALARNKHKPPLKPSMNKTAAALTANSNLNQTSSSMNQIGLGANGAEPKWSTQAKGAVSSSQAEGVREVEHRKPRSKKHTCTNMDPLTRWAQHSVPAVLEASRVATQNLKALSSQSLKAPPNIQKPQSLKKVPQYVSSRANRRNTSQSNSQGETVHGNENAVKQTGVTGAGVKQTGVIPTGPKQTHVIPTGPKQMNVRKGGENSGTGKKPGEKKTSHARKVEYVQNYWEGNRPHYPRLDYIMDRNEFGVPARRVSFQQSSKPMIPALRNQIGEPIIFNNNYESPMANHRGSASGGWQRPPEQQQKNKNKIPTGPRSEKRYDNGNWTRFNHHRNRNWRKTNTSTKMPWKRPSGPPGFW